jgi:hypothetical protein
MMRAAAVLILLCLQDDKVALHLKTLESPGDLRKIYHAVADLASVGEPALPAIEARLKVAQGRSRDYLQLAADEIRAARVLTGLPHPKRVTMKSADRNVVELLNELRTKSGLAVTLENLMGDEKLPEVPIDIRDATMLEAFDAICRAGNVTLTMESGQFMLYPGDYPDLPRFFYDQYFFRLHAFTVLKTVDFRKPAVQSFSIQMEMLWDPAAAPCRFGATVVVEAADDKGKNLVPPPEPPKPVPPPPKPGDEPMDDEAEFVQESLQKLELLTPSPGAQKLAILRGHTTIGLPKDKLSVSFAPDPAKKPEGDTSPFEGLVRKSGDFTVKIVRVEPALCRITCEVSSKTLKPEDLSKMPFLAAVVLKGGEPTRAFVNPWSLKEGVAEVMVGFQPLNLKEVLVVPGGEDRPAPPPVIEKINLSLVTAVQERRIPFEFREVKLK